jgi:hypothetical protein
MTRYASPTRRSGRPAPAGVSPTAAVWAGPTLVLHRSDRSRGRGPDRPGVLRQRDAEQQGTSGGNGGSHGARARTSLRSWDRGPSRAGARRAAACTGGSPSTLGSAGSAAARTGCSRPDPAGQHFRTGSRLLCPGPLPDYRLDGASVDTEPVMCSRSHQVLRCFACPAAPRSANDTQGSPSNQRGKSPGGDPITATLPPERRGKIGEVPNWP